MAILRTLHERRVIGSLMEKGLQWDQETELPDEAFTNALEWLRKTYPIDEQYAAGRWAQSEELAMEQEYISRAERLGIYRPRETSKKAYGPTNSSASVLEEMRIYNEKKEKEEKKKLKAEGKPTSLQELRLAVPQKAKEVKAERMSP